jgi:hypothetical protein
MSVCSQCGEPTPQVELETGAGVCGLCRAQGDAASRAAAQAAWEARMLRAPRSPEVRPRLRIRNCPCCGSAHIRLGELGVHGHLFIPAGRWMWSGYPAQGFACLRCGFLGHYLAEPDLLDLRQWARSRKAGSQPEVPADKGQEEPAPCLRCGGRIPPEADRCPACGWSYKQRRGGELPP